MNMLRNLVCVAAFLAAGSAHAWVHGDPFGTNGTCDPTNDNEVLSVKPSTNLCFSGVPSPVSGSGPYYWTCSGSMSMGTCQTWPAKYAQIPASTSYQPGAYYVDPINGLDTNNGKTPATAFLTPEAAQTAVRTYVAGAYGSYGAGGATIYLMNGTFNRVASVTTSSQDWGETWAAYPGATPVLDGGATSRTTGVADGMILTGGQGITQISYFRVNGITFQHYGHLGIELLYDNEGVVSNNTFQYIYSSSVSGEAAVWGNVARNIKTTNNLMTELSGQAVSLSGQNSSAYQQNDLVFYNKIKDVNLGLVSDAGAIYVADNFRVNTGIGIVYNEIDGSYGKCIYLDNNASYTTVAFNICRGGYTYGEMIHGGNSNTTYNNIFDATNAGGSSSASLLKMFYYADMSCCFSVPNFGLGSNVFTKNIITTYSTSGTGSPQQWLWWTAALLPANWAPFTRYAALAYTVSARNLYETTAGGVSGATFPACVSGTCSDGTVTWTFEQARGPTPVPPLSISNIYYSEYAPGWTNPDMVAGFNAWTVTDANPFFGDPQFTNPTGDDYSFAGPYAANTIGFLPIDQSKIGPQ